VAITATAQTPYKYGWTVNATSADASGCEEIVAAPGAGKYLALDSVTICGNGASVVSFTIGAGDGGAGAVETALLGPVPIQDFAEFRFVRPIRLPANKPLTIDASGAGAVCVCVEGRTI